MISCFKDNHKLVGISKFLVWKRRIDIILEVNEVIDHVHGKISKPSKEPTLFEYMERDLRAQNILKKFIKNPLISYVAELETSKEIYDELVELFSESMIDKTISLRYDLYKLKVSKDEGISSCLSKACQIKGQLRDLNALTDEQGSLISTKEEESIPFIKLRSLCKAEEDRLKKETEKKIR